MKNKAVEVFLNSYLYEKQMLKSRVKAAKASAKRLSKMLADEFTAKSNVLLIIQQLEDISKKLTSSGY
jgi:hypothetical protein